MKAYIYLNESTDDHHWLGYKDEHLKDLRMAAVLNPGDERDPHEALETIFQVCNGADPQSDVLWYMHGNRSLSVGDVVAFEVDGCLEAWACESFGWKRIPFPVTITTLKEPV